MNLKSKGKYFINNVLREAISKSSRMKSMFTSDNRATQKKWKNQKL